EAIALDLGDGDPREEAQLLGEAIHRSRPVPIGEPFVAVRAQEWQVEARAVASARAFSDQHLELAIGADDLERFEERLEDLARERVLLLRPIEHDARDARVAKALQPQRLRPVLDRRPGVGHAGYPFLLASIR